MPTRNSALVLERDPAWREAISASVRAGGLDLELAESVDEAVEKAERGCFRLHIFDVECAEEGCTGGSRGDWAWVSRLGPREPDSAWLWLGRAPEGAPRFPIRFELAKSRGPAQVDAVISAACGEIRRRRVRRWVAGSGGWVPAIVFVEADLIGLSESGLCVESPITGADPVKGFGCRIDALRRLGVRAPLLKLVETRLVLGRDERLAGRNFFQVQGWSGQDRRRLRAWLGRGRLEAVGT